jgi:hypothetical protein
MLADCGDSGLAAHGETLLAIRTQIGWGRLDGQTLFLNCQLLKLCMTSMHERQWMLYSWQGLKKTY